MSTLNVGENTTQNQTQSGGTYFLLRDPFLSFLQLHVVYARLEGEVNSGGLYRDVKYQVILRVILSSTAHRAKGITKEELLNFQCFGICRAHFVDFVANLVGE